MRKILLGVGIVALSLAFANAPVLAATGPTDSTSALVLSNQATNLLAAAKAACTGPTSTKEGCSAAVAAYVSELKSEGLAGKTLDDALVKMVVALATDSSKLSPALQQIVGAVIADLGKQFTDPDRAAIVASIAKDVAAGKVVETAAIDTPASGA
jgi:hypothetical protein